MEAKQGNKIVIIGAGGHARSVIDIILQNQQYDVIGCVDNAEQTEGFLEGMPYIPILGNDNILPELYASGIRYAFAAIGNNALRKRLYEKITGIGFTPATVISKYSCISPLAHIGTGTCVMAGAVINVNVRIGDNCIINTNCSIDHDCIIQGHCHVAPGVAMSGTVHVGELTHIGTGSSIIDQIDIGTNSYIGAGSVIVRNIADNILAYGVPAKKIRNLI
jgi:UDP-perosamine 4-acetyltransferase